MRTIPLDSVIIPPDRQRQDFDSTALSELADSIFEIGLLQAPVFENDGRTLRAGERRIELLSRIEAVMRRSQPRNANQTLVVAPYHFDLARKVLTVDGSVVEMTDKEFELAAFLFRNLGRLLSRGHLLEAVWGATPTSPLGRSTPTSAVSAASSTCVRKTVSG